jgi:hypothetical protein
MSTSDRIGGAAEERSRISEAESTRQVRVPESRRRDVLQDLERPREAENAGNEADITRVDVWNVVAYVKTLRK